MPNQNIPESFSPFHIFYVVMKSADKIQNTASVHCNKMFHHLRHGSIIVRANKMKIWHILLDTDAGNLPVLNLSHQYFESAV